jgi:hypothetical protein
LSLRCGRALEAAAIRVRSSRRVRLFRFNRPLSVEWDAIGSKRSVIMVLASTTVSLFFDPLILGVIIGIIDDPDNEWPGIAVTFGVDAQL